MITRNHQIQSTCGLQLCNGISPSGGPVADLTVRVSTLALHSGKCLQPSRILSPSINNNSKPRAFCNDLPRQSGLPDETPSTVNHSTTVNSPTYESNSNFMGTVDQSHHQDKSLLKLNFHMQSKNNSSIQSLQYHLENLPSVANHNIFSSSFKYQLQNLQNRMKDSIQLLHPYWRKVPWNLQFGWTKLHQHHCEWLQQKVSTGQVPSIFYTSPEEHQEAGVKWALNHIGLPFLTGPSVNTVAEVLEVIHKTHSRRPPYLPADSRGVTEYDADVEDVI